MNANESRWSMPAPPLAFQAATAITGTAAAPGQAPPPATLAGLGRAEKATVVGIDEGACQTSLAAGELERRLLEMGFVEGAVVEILHEGFPGHDPVAVRVGETTIALRRAEAAAIQIEPASRYLPAVEGGQKP